MCSGRPDILDPSAWTYLQLIAAAITRNLPREAIAALARHREQGKVAKIFTDVDTDHLFGSIYDLWMMFRDAYCGNEFNTTVRVPSGDVLDAIKAMCFGDYGAQVDSIVEDALGRAGDDEHIRSLLEDYRQRRDCKDENCEGYAQAFLVISRVNNPRGGVSSYANSGRGMRSGGSRLGCYIASCVPAITVFLYIRRSEGFESDGMRACFRKIQRLAETSGRLRGTEAVHDEWPDERSPDRYAQHIVVDGISYVRYLAIEPGVLRYDDVSEDISRLHDGDGGDGDDSPVPIDVAILTRRPPQRYAALPDSCIPGTNVWLRMDPYCPNPLGNMARVDSYDLTRVDRKATVVVMGFGDAEGVGSYVQWLVDVTYRDDLLRVTVSEGGISVVTVVHRGIGLELVCVPDPGLAEIHGELVDLKGRIGLVVLVHRYGEDISDVSDVAACLGDLDGIPVVLQIVGIGDARRDVLNGHRERLMEVLKENGAGDVEYLGATNGTDARARRKCLKSIIEIVTRERDVNEE